MEPLREEQDIRNDRAIATEALATHCRGDSRSEKMEAVVRKIKKVAEEKDLRVQLGGYHEDEAERVERELWESTIAEAMWSE